MKKELVIKLMDIAEKQQTKSDPSHDFDHIRRVTNLAIEIGKKEKADIDVIIPAALFHDSVVYPKNSPKAHLSTEESAEFAGKVLRRIKEYPQDKIKNVLICIKECSFSKGIKPELLESKILQDADRLEAAGAISIMRTFSSCGQMNRPFYDTVNPFHGDSTVPPNSGLDLFYKRLLIVGATMHTKYARQIAKRRTQFLKDFIKELKLELKESKVI